SSARSVPRLDAARSVHLRRRPDRLSRGPLRSSPAGVVHRRSSGSPCAARCRASCLRGLGRREGILGGGTRLRAERRLWPLGPDLRAARARRDLPAPPVLAAGAQRDHGTACARLNAAPGGGRTPPLRLSGAGSTL